MGIYTATVSSRRLEGIPKLPVRVRERLALANADDRLTLVDYDGSNIIPINFGKTPLSGLTKEILMRMGVMRFSETKESMPILEDLNVYFDDRDEEQSDHLGEAEREDLALFAGGSIFQTLVNTGEILDDFHGSNMYKNKLESLKQYVGLVIREQGIVDLDSLPGSV